MTGATLGRGCAYTRAWEGSRVLSAGRRSPGQGVWGACPGAAASVPMTPAPQNSRSRVLRTRGGPAPTPGPEPWAAVHTRASAFLQGLRGGTPPPVLAPLCPFRGHGTAASCFPSVTRGEAWPSAVPGSPGTKPTPSVPLCPPPALSGPHHSHSSRTPPRSQPPLLPEPPSPRPRPPAPPRSPCCPHTPVGSAVLETGQTGSTPCQSPAQGMR